MTRKRNGLPMAILSVSLGLTLALFFAGCDNGNNNGPPPLTGINVTPSAAQTIIVDGAAVTLTAARVPAEATDEISWETNLPATHANVYVTMTEGGAGTTLTVTGLAPTAELTDGRIGIRAISGARYSAWVFFVVSPAGAPSLTGIDVAPPAAQTIAVGQTGTPIAATLVPTEAAGAVSWETNLPAGHANTYVTLTKSDAGMTLTVTGLASTAELTGGHIGVRAISGGINSAWVFFTVTVDGPPALDGITVSPSTVAPIFVGGDGVSLTAARNPLGATDAIVWVTYPPAALGTYVYFEISNEDLTVYVTGLQATPTFVSVIAQTADGAISSEPVGITVYIAPLHLYGQVWEIDPLSGEWVEFSGNAGVHFILNETENMHSNLGEIAGGQLSFTKGSPDSFALEDIETVFEEAFFMSAFSLMPFFGQAEITVAGSADAAILTFFLDDSAHLVKHYMCMVTMMDIEDVLFMYVSDNVTVTVDETDDGMGAILRGFTLELEAGWNAIHIWGEFCMDTFEASTTVSLDVPDHLKWVRLPGIGIW